MGAQILWEINFSELNNMGKLCKHLSRQANTSNPVQDNFYGVCNLERVPWTLTLISLLKIHWNYLSLRVLCSTQIFLCCERVNVKTCYSFITAFVTKKKTVMQSGKNHPDKSPDKL